MSRSQRSEAGGRKTATPSIDTDPARRGILSPLSNALRSPTANPPLSMPSLGYREIARSTDLEEGKGRPYAIEGHRLALVRHGGMVYALDDQCPHAEASIALGPVENGVIACPWHFAEFELRSGAVLSGPACKGIATYPVKEEDGIVSVALEPLP